MPTDTTEKGLETLIMRHMTGEDGFPQDGASGIQESPDQIAAGKAGVSGWIASRPNDYDRANAIDVVQLFAFLQATQADTLKKTGIGNYRDTKDIARQKFLARISSEIGKRGVIDVLRRGIDHGPLHFDLFYGTPSPGNETAAAKFAQNRFSISRQLRYSQDETRRALDLCAFINGLPLITFELKNSLTKQTVEDAVEQYRRDRDPREKLFQFGRCAVHFAVDDAEVRMCTELKGKASWFLPFNQGWNDGAGNPPNPHGLKTDYLWKEVLTPASLTNILENYAQIIEEKHPKTGKKKLKQIFPRFHQLGCVRELLADAKEHGVGKRYLIQQSAGSGKSNSIAWLSHQLVGLKSKPSDTSEIFDSVIVVTDRRILDDQLQKTVKQFMQVRATVGHAKKSGDLRRFIAEGRKIIITTVQKFPVICDELEGEGTGKNFAIIIDEAHSSQGGKNTSSMNVGLGEKDPEDIVNDVLEKRIKARRLLSNASYFAFTATPKPKTLEMFGIPLPPDAEGKIKHRPFNSYTMKQAVQEGFILDVLRCYTPVESYYRRVKKVEDDPEVFGMMAAENAVKS